MENLIELTSPNNESHALIFNGQLVSYKTKGIELIHGGGKPDNLKEGSDTQGWQTSDLEMFPIIGATNANGYRIKTPNGDCYQDQHGLTRDLAYRLSSSKKNEVILKKVYVKDTIITNGKYPHKSKLKASSWTYNFALTKKISIYDDCLEINFEIEGEKGMPYMFGYHPAFKLGTNSLNSYFQTENNKGITLEDVFQASKSGALMLPNIEEIICTSKDQELFKISTKGFGNMMLWTPDNGMTCIEPITQIPKPTQKYFDTDNAARILNGKDKYSVIIKLLKQKN